MLRSVMGFFRYWFLSERFCNTFYWIETMSGQQRRGLGRWQDGCGAARSMRRYLPSCGTPQGPSRRRVWVAVLAVGFSVIAAGLAGAAEQVRDRPLPKFATVRAVVLRELVRPPERLSSDIVARSEVQLVFDQLRRMGWPVRDEKAIVKQVPGDTDFVLQRLRTPPGRKFMRSIAHYPQGYDRLYRLAALPHGRQTVVRLIESKGGAQMIAYLTQSPGGKNLGQMLQDTPRGREFNRPTGKIFTADALIQRLKQSYTAEVQRRATAAQGHGPSGQ
jgi:hypothetical protein